MRRLATTRAGTVPAVADRVLTERELNRAMLARQCLIERSAKPLARVVEQVGGIQAQYAPSIYIGLWSRMAGLDRAAVTRALERRQAVVATLMRVTIHFVSARDFWPLSHATAPPRRTWWLRGPGRGVDAAAAEAATARLRAALAASGGALRQAEIDALLGPAEGPGARVWHHLLRVPPSSTWDRRRADLYAAAEDWLGAPEADEEALIRTGRELLVRRYLGGFGPASAADIAGWAGLSQRDLAPALASLRLRRFRSEAGEELLDLPRAPLPHASTPVPVRFLPPFDATLLSHARRTGILPDEHRAGLFTSKNPTPPPMFLVDGVVEGTWRHAGGHIELQPFGRLDPAVRRELEDEAERLAAFHA